MRQASPQISCGEKIKYEWRRTGDKPQPGPMLSQFIDAYMRHQGEMSWKIHNVSIIIKNGGNWFSEPTRSWGWLTKKGILFIFSWYVGSFVITCYLLHLIYQYVFLLFYTYSIHLRPTRSWHSGLFVVINRFVIYFIAFHVMLLYCDRYRDSFSFGMTNCGSI